MAVVSTGFFDGVHLGHRRVIETLVRTAERLKEESLVLTFWPHPRIVLQKDADNLRLLSSLEEKKEMLLSLGVDRVEVIPFSREFASMDAQTYLKALVRGVYGASSLVLGYDNTLGSDMLGPEEVKALAGSMGMDCTIVPPFGDISSTRIRRTLQDCDVQAAAAMLGYNYSITGTIVSGKRLGRTIGFPTANIHSNNPLKIVPGRGVYVTDVEIGGSHYHGMTNVGDIVETHILGFNEDIYGMEMRLEFLSFLREMKSFGGLDELKSQLEVDKENILLSLQV
ncbi:MAG: bifunctional riboflavin kinase/FMN adenylyltransferase [Bacteroidales bacterium]|nr:bifunctional riboflavin kinase/FMN adenylyltransferase [Candidatus Cryptobacteroides equifaecalis]